MPTFTSQLWYYGTINSTVRREVGRVLFPSKTQAPLTVPGTDIRSFHVTRDGRTVAMSADTTVTGRFDVVLVNHDGTNLRTLVPTTTGAPVTYVRFAPNGQRLSFEMRDSATTISRLFVVSTSGGAPIDVTPTRASPSDVNLNIINSTWSRDSRYLAIVAESTYDRLNELYVVDMNASTPTPTALLTTSTLGMPGTSGFWGVTSPVQWSVSSRNELIFKHRTLADTAFRLMRILPNGTGFGVVPGTPDGTSMFGYVGSYGIADDGFTLFYTADTVTQQAYEVYRATIGSPAAGLQVSNNAVAGRRPDFNRAIESNSTSTNFAFGANWISAAQYDPWVVPAAGPPVQLATFPAGAYIDDLMWSPNGQQLAAVADSRIDETFDLLLFPSVTGLGTPELLVTPLPGGDVLDSTWTP